MGSKKRSKPTSKAEAPQSLHGHHNVGKDVGIAGNESTSKASSADPKQSSDSQTVKSNGSSTTPGRFVQGFSMGTWPRVSGDMGKSSPSTQVARETILADKKPGAAFAADFSRFEPKRTEPSISEEISISRPPSMNIGKGQETVNLSKLDEVKDSKLSDTVNSKAPIKAPSSVDVDAQLTRPATSSGWLGWFSHSGVPPNTSQESAQPLTDPSREETHASVPNVETIVETNPAPTSLGSWFKIWPTSAGKSQPPLEEEVNRIPVTTAPETAGRPSCADDPDTTATAPVQPPKGSSWGFWSRQPVRSSQGLGQSGEDNENGELAVAGEPTQSHPTAAYTLPIAEPSKDLKIEPSMQKKKPKREKSEQNNTTLGPSKASSSETVAKSSPAPSIVTPKTTQPHLLLPAFESTYHMKENPSVIQQIARLLMHGQQPVQKHVFLVKNPPRVKKALAIGIHGLFPASFLRPVIGQPTGTSIRFANHAADAIERWSDAHGYECEIEKVALEGEGKIAERVDNLWKLLLNWVDHVRESDFVLVACHSQGVPVAMILVAKLIEFGVVSSAKIGVCAMAGVSLGPFQEYKARFFGGSTAELFEFADPESDVSKRYEQSLRVALDYGVRITYVGSIDDQLVSLESAIFSSANHPYIYRAVFVDGRVHAPDFIAHLVGFALKLRNLGVSDHGLIRELSAPLAGSLYTGGGHSSLYDEPGIYDLAISFTLETSSIGKVPLQIQKHIVPVASNPFQLPWSMRGLLEENVVKTELDEETRVLLQQFDEWKPVTKGLKDVKYRLEAIKSRL